MWSSGHSMHGDGRRWVGWVWRLVGAGAVFGLLLGAPAATQAIPFGDSASAPTLRTHPQGDAVVAEASAEVVPSRSADLGLTVPGQVARLAVAEGDTVEAGQLLVGLDTAAVDAEIAQAEAALAAAEAQLALLRAQPRTTDVAVAEAQLGVAEAALAEAIARWSEVAEETRRAVVAGAEADVANAKAQEMGARITEIQQREFGIEDWQAEVNLLRLRSAELALEAAEARLAEVPEVQRSTLAQLSAVILEREALRDQAASALSAAREGASAEELAIAEARVAQAAVRLRRARSRLASLSLYAPFDGTVVGVATAVGQAAVPGQVLLTLADLRPLEVETTDLSERDVSGVAVGMRGTVAIEALDIVIPGHVTRIAAKPTVVGGDVTYPVRLALDQTPPELRWGMRAEVVLGDTD